MAEIRKSKYSPTVTHWGAYQAEVREGRLIALHPFPHDPDPSPIGRSIPGAVTDRLRIPQPMIRQGWLEHGPRRNENARGSEPFIPVPWDEALDLVARELSRVKEAHGNAAIFAGSLLVIIAVLVGVGVRSFPGAGDREVIELRTEQPVYIAVDRMRRLSSDVPAWSRKGLSLVESSRQAVAVLTARKESTELSPAGYSLSSLDPTAAALIELPLPALRERLAELAQNGDKDEQIYVLNLEYVAKDMEEARVERVDVVGKGLYRIETGERIPEATAPTGAIEPAIKFTNIEETETVPARIGVEFGLDRIVGEPDGGEVAPEFLVNYPEGGLADPESPTPCGKANTSCRRRSTSRFISATNPKTTGSWCPATGDSNLARWPQAHGGGFQRHQMSAEDAGERYRSGTATIVPSGR